MGKDRPAEPKTVFERIPDTAENIAKAVLATKPRKAKDWEYMKRGKK